MTKSKKSKRMSDEVLMNFGFTKSAFSNIWHFNKYSNISISFNNNPTYDQFIDAFYRNVFGMGEQSKVLEVRKLLWIMN